MKEYYNNEYNQIIVNNELNIILHWNMIPIFFRKGIQHLLKLNASLKLMPDQISNL